MAKILLVVATALLLAACAYTAPGPQAAANPNPMTSGVGHPAPDYPGPRAY